MFLNELTKNESAAFINLIKNLSLIDDDISKKEEDLINEYKEELKLSLDEINDLSFEASISELSNSSFRTKNIIYFELAGLALVDGIFEKKEEEFLDKIAATFEIPSNKQLSYLNFFKQVKDFYDITFDECESMLENLNKKAQALLPQ